MHDIRLIRDNPAAFDAALKARGAEPLAENALRLDEALRAAVTAKQDAETARNAASKSIGKAKASGDEGEFERLRGEVARLKDVLETEGEKEAQARAALEALLAGAPNTALEGVPEGADEDSNVEARRWGEPKSFDFDVKDHVALGEGLEQMDFETAATMSGARFVVLSGPLARLDRALAQFMLDVQTGENGYTEVAVPYLVRGDALYGTGQLPKFEEDLFKTTDERYLIPTAEVPLTNIVAGSIVEESYLPRRYTGLTPCFRSEAGSAGRDTRGMIRMHQFHKVELVSVVKSEEGEAELERMTGCAEDILKRLELPYRVMTLCTGDMGFAARKTYDLEVWIPSQEGVSGDLLVLAVRGFPGASDERALSP